MGYGSEQKIITSRQNPNILFARSLAEKRHRDKAKLFVFEGVRLLEEALLCGVEPERIFYTSKAADAYPDLLQSASDCGAALYSVTDSVYDKLTGEKAPQGIFVCARKRDHPDIDEHTPSSRGFVILEDIQNPSNVGAIIRSAVSLGADKLLLTPGCADVYGAKVVRAAMGSLFRASIYRTDHLPRSIAALQKNGHMVYACTLSQDAISLSDLSFSKRDCLVFGNEGSGVLPETAAICDERVVIPMYNGSDSLNAAAAAAIFIWETRRQ